MITPRVASLFFVCAALSACAMDSPSVGYGQTPHRTVTIDGNTYIVYVQNGAGRAEAHRVNAVFPPPSRMLIIAQAVRAIVLSTGCAVEGGSLVGDQAIVKAVLLCNPR